MFPIGKDDSARRKRDIRPEYSVVPDDDLYGSPRSWTGAQWSDARRDATLQNPASQDASQARKSLPVQEETEPFILKSPSPQTDHARSAAYSQDRLPGRFAPPTIGIENTPAAIFRDRSLYRRGAESGRNRRGPHDSYGVAHERGVSTWTLQILASAFLLGVTALMFHSNRPIALQVRQDMRQMFATDFIRDAPSVVKTTLGADAVSPTTTISVSAPPLDVVAPVSGPITRTYSVISPDIVLHGRPGSVVVAATDGLVVAAGESQANGSYVLIDHGAFGQTFYAHLGKVVVHVQEYVTAGETIGYLPNNSGNLTFGYIRGGSYRDPKSILGLAK